MESNEEDDLTHQPKKPTLAKNIANLFQRFIVVLLRFIFKNIIYGKGQSMPPIKNLLLLEPASVLAMKIRTKKVSYSGI